MAAISAMTRSNENPDSEGLAGGPAADQGVRPTSVLNGDISSLGNFFVL